MSSSRRSAADPPRPVTISHIARTAGVSVPTVSKVINGRAGVAPGTRARVESLISEYGYRKSGPPAGGTTIELVFAQNGDLPGIEIIQGVQQVAREHQLGVVLSGSGADPGRYWLDHAVSRRSLGVVAVAQLDVEEQDQLRRHAVPFVIVDPAHELPDDVPFVGATNWSGGRAAARHLLGLGHRRIATVTGPGHVLSCRARFDGHRSALEEAGLTGRSKLVTRQELTREGGRAAAGDLLARPDRPTAVVTGNDLQAVGVYQAARAAGLRIPEDLSVIGFDDLPVAAQLDPPLTTVHRPLGQMAVTATEMALALGRGERPAQTGIELATTLAVRHSAAPPAA
ncbi:LacI family DNA-binding transcriptional regulator [Micromonospora wenchangensis]|uniref:LacI family DNA-binding transcriptional regulator n=1 Tax=Micromonospora wenchangensis TaxID=1185415 RepID=UPI00341466A4